MKKKTKEKQSTEISVPTKSSALTVEQERIKSAITANMPEFVKGLETKEDLGNAMYAASQEMMLATIDVLVRYHEFSDDEVKKFTQELKDILTGTKEFEKTGLSILSGHSMATVGDKVQETGIEGLMMELATVRHQKERMTRAGIESPLLTEATPFIKQLKKRNEGR